MALPRHLHPVSARLHRGSRSAALLLSVLLLSQSVLGFAAPAPALAATPTITWTTQADFEANASTTGETTTLLNADTATSPGDVMIGGPALTIASGEYHVIGVRGDGSAMATGGEFASFGAEKNEVGGWSGVITAEGGYDHTAGLRSDGTVVVTETYGEQDVSGWTDIVDIATGWAFTVGVKSDGTVLGTGRNAEHQLDTAGWTDIRQVDTGQYFTLGLKSDGSVVATGANSNGQLGVGAWTGITSIAAGAYHSVGLKSDGTVIAVGSDSNGQVSGVAGWEDIVAIAASGRHTVGLRDDGTVVAVGENLNGALDVSGWTEIVAISTGWDHTLGIKTDGTVVAAGPDDIVGDVPEAFSGELGMIGGPDYHFDYGFNADIGEDGVLEELAADFDALRPGEAVKFALRIYDGTAWTPLLGFGGQPIDWTSGTGNYFGRAFGDAQPRTGLSALPDGWFVEIVVRLEGTLGTSPVLHSITLNPSEEPPVTHTVTFVDWDGAVLKTQEVEHGSGATAPDSPAREGYTFTGWSPADFSTITSDLTVTAQYVPDIVTHTVAFDAHGGVPVPTEQSVAHGAYVSVPVRPAKSNAIFRAWYSDAALTERWDFATDTVTGDINLHAGWIDLIRYAGIDRYDTAYLAALDRFAEGADVAIVAVGTNFPDALAASSLAGTVDAPILLTRRDTLHPLTKKALGELGVSKVYIMGEDGAVSDEIEAEIGAMPGIDEVVRLGGPTRYETARLIAEEVVRLDGPKSEIFLVRGDEFPDALSVSSMAAQLHMPILLTKPSPLNTNVAEFIGDYGIDMLYVAGGEAVVTPATVDQALAAGAEGFTRWAGANRYSTSTAVVRGAHDTWDIATEKVGLATGELFPDALTGGAIMGRQRGVLVLCYPTAVLQPTEDLLLEIKPDITQVEFFGGVGALSQGVWNRVLELLQP